MPLTAISSAPCLKREDYKLHLRDDAKYNKNVPAAIIGTNGRKPDNCLNAKKHPTHMPMANIITA